MIEQLFEGFLEKHEISANLEYRTLSQKALEKEKELREMLTPQQETCFEQLFEITMQLHYIEVKEAFGYACKVGANASKELLI